MGKPSGPRHFLFTHKTAEQGVFILEKKKIFGKKGK